MSPVKVYYFPWALLNALGVSGLGSPWTDARARIKRAQIAKIFIVVACAALWDMIRLYIPHKPTGCYHSKNQYSVRVLHIWLVCALIKILLSNKPDILDIFA